MIDWPMVNEQQTYYALRQRFNHLVQSGQSGSREAAQLFYERLQFQIQLLSAPRRISCTGDRTPAQEVLAVRGLDISV